MTWTADLQDGYQLSTDRDRLDLPTVSAFLSTESYWAKGRSAELISRSIDNSLAFGLYDGGGSQAGLTRVVGDGATFGYVCDVFVLTGHRGRGLGKAMLAAVLTHPDVAPLSRLMLATADAHDLYARYGFTELVEPRRWMERRSADFNLPPMES
ncbi:MAG: GNAT family N-acetyltransferase [Acidimicrobiales bacterium]